MRSAVASFSLECGHLRPQASTLQGLRGAGFGPGVHLSGEGTAGGVLVPLWLASLSTRRDRLTNPHFRFCQAQEGLL